jgi:replicative DNA helicase
MHAFGTDVIASIVSGIAVLLIAYIARQAWKAVRSIGQDKVQREKDHLEVIRRLDQQDEKLVNIEHETHLNSGTSLKDATMRTEARVAKLDTALEEHLRDAKYQQGKLDAYFAQLTGSPTISVNAPPPA